MTLDERLVRFAARLLPRANREARLEEWLADLDGAIELRMPRRDVSLGALQFAITEPSLREHLAGVRPRTWFLGGMLAIAAVVIGVPIALVGGYLIEQVRGVVTEEVVADGSTQAVHWKEYPGIVELSPEETLTGPSLEDGLDDGDAMITEIQARLTAQLGIQWGKRPSAPDAVFPAQNYFGGDSMLVGINLSGSSSEDVPRNWADKRRAIAIVAEVITEYGFETPKLDQYLSPMTAAEITDAYGSAVAAEQASVNATSMGPNGQWFNVSMFDSSKDVDGRLGKRGFGPDSISLFYGANALLPQAVRAEFEKRLKPYEGFALPEPIED